MFLIENGILKWKWNLTNYVIDIKCTTRRSTIGAT